MSRRRHSHQFQQPRSSPLPSGPSQTASSPPPSSQSGVRITALPDELLCRIASFIDLEAQFITQLDPVTGVKTSDKSSLKRAKKKVDKHGNPRRLCSYELLQLIVSSRLISWCFYKIGTEVLRLRLDTLYIHPSEASITEFDKIRASSLFAQRISRIVVIGARWEPNCLMHSALSTFAGISRVSLMGLAVSRLGSVPDEAGLCDFAKDLIDVPRWERQMAACLEAALDSLPNIKELQYTDRIRRTGLNMQKAWCAQDLYYVHPDEALKQGVRFDIEKQVQAFACQQSQEQGVPRFRRLALDYNAKHTKKQLLIKIGEEKHPIRHHLFKTISNLQSPSPANLCIYMDNHFGSYPPETAISKAQGMKIAKLVIESPNNHITAEWDSANDTAVSALQFRMKGDFAPTELRRLVFLHGNSLRRITITGALSHPQAGDSGREADSFETYRSCLNTLRTLASLQEADISIDPPRHGSFKLKCTEGHRLLNVPNAHGLYVLDQLQCTSCQRKEERRSLH